MLFGSLVLYVEINIINLLNCAYNLLNITDFERESYISREILAIEWNSGVKERLYHFEVLKFRNFHFYIWVWSWKY